MKSPIFAAIAAIAICAGCSDANVKGTVSCNGTPISGVCVSDGRQIVTTDANGHYEMKTDKADSVVFITTPSGYVAKPLDNIRPGFWAILDKPVEQCEQHDFELVAQDQSAYSVLFITDCHFANDPERKDLEQFKAIQMPNITKAAEDAAAKGAVYTFNLGDFSHDRFWYDCNFNEADACNFLNGCNFPTVVYTITGNHDNDGAISHLGDANDFESAWCYRHTWGPDRYSVNIGADHWIVMDNVVYINDGEPDKKHKNIGGKRNYRCRFTEDQLEWLRKDLEYVDDSTRIFFAAHVPLFNDASKSERLEETQLDTLDAIFSRFSKVTAFAGHTHKVINTTCGGYGRFRQFIFNATSGNMWQAPAGYQHIGTDGSDASVSILDCSAEDPEPFFISARHGHRMCRIYDANKIAEYYRNDPQCKIMHSLYPERTWFAAPEFRNVVLVNHWGLKPGQSLIAEENGKSLEVKQVKYEDPLAVITYTASKLKPDSKASKSAAKDKKCPHLYSIKARTATAPVTIKLVDADGNVIGTETFRRPCAFGKDAE